MKAICYPHIEIDERGRPWIPAANTKVIEIVMSHLSNGWSAQELHGQFPHLTLGQIHSSLAYYHDHRAEMDDAIGTWNQSCDELLESLPVSPAVEHIRAQGRK